MRGAAPELSPRNEGMSALSITAIYLVAGGLWILFSDALESDVIHRLFGSVA